MESSLIKAVERLLHEMICEALRLDMEYEEFVSALLFPRMDLSRKIAYTKLADKIETLIETIYGEIIKYPQFVISGDDLLNSLTSERKTIARAYIIDNIEWALQTFRGTVNSEARSFGSQNF